MNKSTCCINKCEKPVLAKFLCSKHYNRLRSTGTTRLIPKPKKKCRMPGCDNPSRKLGWCTKHHHRVRKYGSPFALKYNKTKLSLCLVCNNPTRVDYYSNKFCSNSCAVIASRGERRKYKTCVVCEKKFPLYERNESGRMRNSSATACVTCKREPHLSKYVPHLLARDGSDCSICKKRIDMSLEYPDQMSVSVDHAIPRSKGGPDHISNYRIAHWICNVKLQDRVDGLF